MPRQGSSGPEPNHRRQVQDNPPPAPLFEFADIRYRAEFLLNVDKNAFTIASQTNDYVWKDGKKASLDTEVLRLAYDGTLATDALTNLDSPEHYAFAIERYVQMLGPAYLELHGQP